MMEYNLGNYEGEQVQEEQVEIFELNEGVENHPSIRPLAKAATLNSKRDEMNVYVSGQTGVSYTGSRKYWGGSDLFMRSILHDSTEPLDLDGSVNVMSNHVAIGDGIGQGLLGPRHPNGKREIVTPERANEIFEDVVRNEKFEHQLLINPLEFSDFIDPMLQFSQESTKTISIMPSRFLNSRGHFVGILRKRDIRIYWRGNGQEFEEQFYVEVERDQRTEEIVVTHSLISNLHALENQPVMVNYIGEVQMEDGLLEHTCEVVMDFQPGVMVSVQDYDAGHVLPMLDAYSVIPNEDKNSLRSQATRVFDFIDGQEPTTANSGPMLTFALSTFRAILAATEEFRAIEILYSNRTRRCLVRSVDYFGEVPYKIEAIVAPISPFVYGKVLTH